jgi:hypothetical protein
MRMLSQWILPIAMGAVGIAIFTGLLLRELPDSTGLRPLLGIVTVLLGVHRFVAARMKRDDGERRFGGGVRRPWE